MQMQMTMDANLPSNYGGKIVILYTGIYIDMVY